MPHLIKCIKGPGRYAVTKPDVNHVYVKKIDLTENNITYNYKNKTVLVCGGSRGIGAGVVDALLNPVQKYFTAQGIY